MTNQTTPSLPNWMQVMLVMPNSTESIYTRLWCVAEIKVAKDLNLPIRVAYDTGTAMRQLLTNFTSVRNAQCSEQSDEARIRGAIAGQEDAIDSLVEELVDKQGVVDLGQSSSINRGSSRFDGR